MWPEWSGVQTQWSGVRTAAPDTVWCSHQLLTGQSVHTGVSGYGEGGREGGMYLHTGFSLLL